VRWRPIVIVGLAVAVVAGPEHGTTIIGHLPVRPRTEAETGVAVGADHQA
jgi:hypothetical protein